MDFKNKLCVISGGGGDIAKAIINDMLSKGIGKIIALDIYFKDKLQDERIEYLDFNLADFKCYDKITRYILEKYQRVDILINCAGINRDSLFIKSSEEDLDAIMDVNFKASFMLIRYLVKPMLRAKKGAIVNISSVVAMRGNVGQASYSSSKSALIGLTKSLALEFGPRNVRVNAVAPGYIKTCMTDKLDKNYLEDKIKNIALRRIGNPEEVAKLVCFLASEDASYISGETISVSGGYY